MAAIKTAKEVVIYLWLGQDGWEFKYKDRGVSGGFKSRSLEEAQDDLAARLGDYEYPTFIVGNLVKRFIPNENENYEWPIFEAYESGEDKIDTRHLSADPRVAFADRLAQPQQDQSRRIMVSDGRSGPFFLAGAGPRVKDLIDRVKGGDSPENVAADFDVPLAWLEDAISLLDHYKS